MVQFNTRRQKLNDEETAELGKLQATIGAQIAALQRQINSADQTSADEIRVALQKIQRAYIDSYLSRTMISSASITGIGEKFTLRLKRQGIHCYCPNLVVATVNVGHLLQFVSADLWANIKP